MDKVTSPLAVISIDTVPEQLVGSYYMDEVLIYENKRRVPEMAEGFLADSQYPEWCQNHTVDQPRYLTRTVKLHWLSKKPPVTVSLDCLTKRRSPLEAKPTEPITA